MRGIFGLAVVIGLMCPSSVLGAGGGGDSTSSSISTPADRDWARAQDLVDSGELEKAIPALLEVVRRNDQHANAYNLLGFAHRKTGKLDAAL